MCAGSDRCPSLKLINTYTSNIGRNGAKRKRVEPAIELPDTFLPTGDSESHSQPKLHMAIPKLEAAEDPGAARDGCANGVADLTHYVTWPRGAAVRRQLEDTIEVACLTTT